jgi:adenosylcobinamide-phosphate synthase
VNALRGDAAVAALLLDAAFGEPPATVHPTVMMGRAISVFEQVALSPKNPIPARLSGLALALALPTLVYLCARAILRLVPRSLRWPVEAALISTTLSMRGLAEAAVAVERELKNDRLNKARERVGEFVGRDTKDLSETGVARAAIESVAENTSDAVVAPMIYAFLFGASGVLAYKAVNTLDSMVGYRNVKYEQFGWASARLDDLANLAPSRVTAITAAIFGGPAAFRTALRFGPLTESPNAGWTEAAFAGALGVQLGGANSYGSVPNDGPILGDGRSPVTEDIPRAVRLMRCCCVLLAALAFLAGRAGRG